MALPGAVHPITAALAVLALTSMGCDRGRPADHARHTAGPLAATRATTVTMASRPHANPAKPNDETGPTGPPRDPPTSMPTRLVGGPVMLRVISHGRYPRLRYALIFRLNRDYPHWPRPRHDPDAPPPLPTGAWDPVGNVSFAGFTFLWDNPIGTFDAARLTRMYGEDTFAQGVPDVDDCYIGTIHEGTEWDPRFFEKLDAIPDGGRIRVRIRPLTPKPDSRPMYARAYVRHPRIVPARATGSYLLTIRSPAALAALREAGCTGTVMY